MQIGRLDHVNIRTRQLDAMIRWYEEVLGMEHGDRPPSRNEGAWLYADGLPIVHLVEDPNVAGGGDPTLEHYAIRATGLSEFLARLSEMEIDHSVIDIASVSTVQVNVADPDGNHIHIDFGIAEKT